MQAPGHRAVGLTIALASAAMFATSGAFARPLLDAGWSPAGAVLVRLGLGSLLLAIPGLRALRGRWGIVREKWRPILAYGVFSGAAVQVAYFNAITYIEVGIALMLEYLGVVLVVLYVWARTRRRPGSMTLIGMLVAVGGLAVILNPTSVAGADPRGIAWGLFAATGMAVYFVVSAQTDGIPPLTFVSLGLGVGALALLLAGMVGLVPLTFSTADVRLFGGLVPWWVPLIELAVIAAALAYASGFVAARRLGPTVASFVGLTEVVFAVLWAWLLLGELPGPVQLLGGTILLLGVVAVQAGVRRDAVRDLVAAPAAARDAAPDAPTPGR
ncbi:MAG: DMT family transporter [Propionibacteriaceae bacterium]|nr:DMT family transporter [Propionibacteriaceae bacterium]